MIDDLTLHDGNGPSAANDRLPKLFINGDPGVIQTGRLRELVRARDFWARTSRIAKPLIGATLVSVGVLVLTGFDKVIEASLTRAMPDWLVTVTTRL